MKKLLTIFLVGVLVLSLSGLLFAAENVADVAQTGDDNEVDIEQIGHNKAEVEQKGNKNEAAVYQEGNNFPSLLGGWYYLGAHIDQIGNRNEALINMPTSSNATRIQQRGNDNKAQQSLGSTQHKSTDFNRLGMHIKQFGDENEAYQETEASFGSYGIQDMFIKQDGDNNFVEQFSKGGMQTLMEAEQIGNDNISYQHQDARFSKLHLRIKGDNNFTDQYQEYTVWADSGDQDAYADINGDNNRARQKQVGEYGNLDLDITGNKNIVKQEQIGDENEALMRVVGNQNDLKQEQVGNLNQALLKVVGNKNTRIYQYTQSQTGENNFAEADLWGHNNKFFQSQLGDNNQANMKIRGNRNFAKQVQENDNNLATIRLTGHNNTVYQYQDGNDTSLITVKGDGNYTSVNQM